MNDLFLSVASLARCPIAQNSRQNGEGAILQPAAIPEDLSLKRLNARLAQVDASPGFQKIEALGASSVVS